MDDITYRTLDAFPEPDFGALVDDAFADYQESDLLAEVARQELAARPSAAPPGQGPVAGPDAGRALRIGAFCGDRLVGWTFAQPEGASLLYMVNSGVASTHRRQGIYSQLARQVIAQAQAQGYAVIQSRHAAGNNAVIIAKLRLGFMVSGFEYSEVYGPLVRLTMLLGSLRRTLYQDRSRPIRRARPRQDSPAE